MSQRPSLSQYWHKLNTGQKFKQAFWVFSLSLLLVIMAAVWTLTNTAQVALTIFIIVTILAFILTLATILLLNRTLVRNIVKLTDAATQLEQGNLNAPLTLDADDALNRLANAVNQVSEYQRTQETLRRQNDYLEALHETAIGLISHLDLDELLEDIISRAGQLLGAEHSYIYLVNPRNGELERKVGVGIYSQSIGFVIKPGEGIAGRVWQTGSPLVINDIKHWAGRSPNIDYSKISSLAGVPLISRSKVVGVLGMAHAVEGGRAFEDGEIKLITRFAQLASLALENARLYTAAQAEKQRSDDLLNVVIPIGVALSAEQNFDRLLEKILLEAKTFCRADAGTLYLRTENDELRFVIVRNDSLNIDMGGTSGRPIDFPPVPLYDTAGGEANHSNVAAHVALTGESINIPDAYQAEGFNFSGTKAFDQNTSYRSTSFLTIPLKNAHGYVVGVLQLINALDPATRQIIPFDRSLEQIVSSLSSLATVALESYIRERTLRQQIQQLRIEIDEAKRQKQVTEIIETDFFQDLQQKARRIRSRSGRFQSQE